QIVNFFTEPHEPDRNPEPVGNRNHHSPLCGAVKLGQDYPGERDRIAEDLRLAERILSGVRIQHQPGFVRSPRQFTARDPRDLFQLLHQVDLGLQTPRGVDYYRPRIARDGGLDRIEGNRGRVGAWRLLNHVDAGAIAPDLELFDRGGAKGVRGRDDHVAALGLEPGRQLGDRGGFPHTVNPHHHDDQRRLAGIRGRARGSLEDACDFRFERIAYDVGTAVIAQPGTHRFDDLQTGFDADIRSDQGLFETFVELLGLLAARDR